jgi:tetratricopeptide (TPR) repeat protein
MKKYLTRLLACCAAVVCLIGPLTASAASYSTYTYDKDGFSMASPDAYTPESVVDSKSIGLETALNSPTDIEVDDDGNVYIADPNNNRIVILNKYYKYKSTISTFVNDQGVSDSLNQAQGLFVWEGKVVNDDGGYEDQKYIYVADTENARIVVFDGDGNYVRTLEEPSSDVFEDDEIYKPVALAVDSAGRIYVVSSTTYQGIISLTNDGDFSGYIGAIKASYNALEMIWRKFQTAEQRAQSETNTSVEYNNIAIDDEGFVYVTTNAIETSDLESAINGGSSDYAPVKKLNTNGDDIMRRNGFFIPAGEIDFKSSVTSTDSTIAGPSSIVDVAVGPEGTWSIVDYNRSKIFTYNENGDLLYAFGDMGTQMGNLQQIVGLVYQDEKLLVLDKQTSSFTVYKMTEYGELLLNAIRHDNNRQYSLAADDWEAILQRNNNFDSAYIGLGKAYYRQGDWETAMEYFKIAYDTDNYSTSFGNYRKDWVSQYIWIIPIVVIVFCFLVYKFFKYAGKVNKRAATSGKKKTYWEELLYSMHLIFHPFDGFWDLKHEKRGSVRGAFTILGLAVLSFSYQAVGRAYIFNPYGGYASVIGQISSLLLPILLGVTANWCLTTLFDGEGSFKDIFVAICYSLTPIILIVPITTLLTHICTSSEEGFINLLLSCCYVWVGLLIFFGMMVTHDYSLGKNVITLLGTILCACVIMFVAILFSSLVIKMVSFVSNIITEVTYNM